MTRRKATVSEWRECPQCGYPMTRWGRLKRVPERNWRGEPERHVTPSPLFPDLLDILLIVLSEALVQTFAGQDDQVRFDVIGVLGAVVSGVSFLGAGAIFSSKRGENMKGLTTAAGLLATAAVGVACGLHLYVIATIATLLFLFTLGPLSRLSGRVHPGQADG